MYYVTLLLANTYISPKIIKYSLVSGENKSKVMLSFLKKAFLKNSTRRFFSSLSSAVIADLSVTSLAQ